MARCRLTLAVTGTVTVDRAGSPARLPLTATAEHTFAERVEAVGPGGGRPGDRGCTRRPGRAGETGVERSVRHAAGRPAGGRRPARPPTGPTHYSPAGPLTRDELDLVAEHFDTLAVTGLLPPGPVAVGGTWPVPADVVTRRLCQFDGAGEGRADRDAHGRHRFDRHA